MRFSDPLSVGSRRRYLAEQAAFLADLEAQDPLAQVSKGLRRSKKPLPEGTFLRALDDSLVQLRAKQQVKRAPLKRGGFLEALDASRKIRKADLKTTLSDAEAKQIAGKYGVKGPLPKDLPREERMRAYEGRYLAAGGRKAEKWQRHAAGADKVRNVALAGGVAAGTAWLGAKTPLGRKAAGRLSKVPGGNRLAHAAGKHSETAAVATATVGGGAELYAGRARKKRASYSGTPGGVAASALRRMQAYTPD